MTESVLSIENLRCWIETREHYVRAVDGVSLSLQRGETLALLGESGCGKSLTALSILKLLPHNAVFGEESKIKYLDKNIVDFSEQEMRKIRGRRISMIFQEPMTSLNPVLTVAEQLKEALKLVHSNVTQADLIDLLTQVGIPAPLERLHQYPHELSGGMKQRVMIAMAIAGKPDVLIADEPTTALDVTIQAQILSLLKNLQKQTGMAIIFISHDLSVVRQMADRVAIMYAGHIVEHALADDFFKQPQHPYSQQLFQSLPSGKAKNVQLAVIGGQVPKLTEKMSLCRFKNRCSQSFAACSQQAPRWFTPSPSRGVRCHLNDPHLINIAHADNNEQILLPENNIAKHQILQINNLKVYFPIKQGLFQRTVNHVKAIDGVTLGVRQGETLAIVGESGCGKSTLAKAIMRLNPISAGSIIYNGRDYQHFSRVEKQQLAADIQLIFQDPYSALNPRMMVKDLITEGLAVQRKISSAEQVVIVTELLNDVGLPTDAMYRYPHEFSGGQRQRIAIARALALKPRLLVCDEPTSALDVSVQAQILNLLKKLQREHGLSYVFISHDISVVEYMADSLAVMYLGRVIEQGNAHTIIKQPKHPYTQALLASVPQLEQAKSLDKVLAGDLPSPISPPQGCPFHTRCPHVQPECKKNYPETINMDDNVKVNCIVYAEDKYY